MSHGLTACGLDSLGCLTLFAPAVVLPPMLEQDILDNLDHQSWNSRWLEVLAKENERGFHPAMLACSDGFQPWGGL